MATIYLFADGSRITGVAPQVVGERLAHLSSVAKILTPKLVVDDARPVESPLHPAFEWDDQVAAELHREHTARQLIKNIRVVSETESEEGLPRRMYLNVHADDMRGYLPVQCVMADGLLRQQALVSAKKELTAWRNRYREISELANIFQVIDSTMLGTTEEDEE